MRFLGIATQRKSAYLEHALLSSWEVSISGELLSSRAHIRFDTVNDTITTVFNIFNLPNLRESYLDIAVFLFSLK